MLGREYRELIHRVILKVVSDSLDLSQSGLGKTVAKEVPIQAVRLSPLL